MGKELRESRARWWREREEAGFTQLLTHKSTLLSRETFHRDDYCRGKGGREKKQALEK